MGDWVLRNKKHEITKTFKTDDEKFKYAKKLFEENKNLKSIGGRPSIHPKVKDQVHELRLKGLSYDKISKQLNISKGSVWNIINKNQV